MNVTIVDSTDSMIAFLDNIEHAPTLPPSLYLDLEGTNLSRHGSISIIQAFVLPLNEVYLLDVHILQDAAFSTPNLSGTTFKSILENGLIPKVIFDVRNDSDALFAHSQVSMKCVYDVQLMELGCRSNRKGRISGLAKCIEHDLQLSAAAKAAWRATKEIGQALFATELGGSYEVFNIRPMRPEIIEYCVNDVIHLPALWKLYSRKLTKQWATKVQEETRRRLATSETPSYDPHGDGKTMSPWATHSKQTKSSLPAQNSKTESRSSSTRKASVAKETATGTTGVLAAKELQQIPVNINSIENTKSRPTQDSSRIPQTQKISPGTAQLNQLSPFASLPLRKKPVTFTTPSPALAPQRTCFPCQRTM